MNENIENLRAALARECAAIEIERNNYRAMVFQLETYLAERGPKPSDDVIEHWNRALRRRLAIFALHKGQVPTGHTSSTLRSTQR
jgi:hypothetical protein